MWPSAKRRWISDKVLRDYAKESCESARKSCRSVGKRCEFICSHGDSECRLEVLEGCIVHMARYYKIIDIWDPF